MNDFLIGLLQNLASAAIGGGVVILARKYVEYLRHRMYSTFWELPGGRAVIVRSIASRRGDPDNPERKVWMSDLFSTMTVETLWKFLNEKGLAREVQIVGSNVTPNEGIFLRENIVFIGGTLGNPVCMEECEHLQQTKDQPLPYYWHGQDVRNQGERILRSADQTISYPTVLQGNRIVDYGLVLKTRNHRNNARWIYVLAGNLGIGTYAAAGFVTSAPRLQEFGRSWKRGTSLCFVIKGVAEEYSLVEEPEIVAPPRPV